MAFLLLYSLLIGQFQREIIKIPSLGLQLIPPVGWSKGIHHSFPELKGVYLSPQGARLAIVIGKKNEVYNTKVWLKNISKTFKKNVCKKGNFLKSLNKSQLFLTCTNDNQITALRVKILKNTPLFISFKCNAPPKSTICQKPFKQYELFVSQSFGQSQILQKETPFDQNQK